MPHSVTSRGRLRKHHVLGSSTEWCKGRPGAVIGGGGALRTRSDAPLRGRANRGGSSTRARSLSVPRRFALGDQEARTKKLLEGAKSMAHPDGGFSDFALGSDNQAFDTMSQKCFRVTGSRLLREVANHLTRKDVFAAAAVLTSTWTWLCAYRPVDTLAQRNAYAPVTFHARRRGRDG